MFVCPQCQFENPDNHKFCQKCGTSLTELVCPGCEAVVSVEEAYCPHCGTLSGVIWQAIATSSADAPPLQLFEDNSSATATSELPDTEPDRPAPVATAPELPDCYLDAQHRYQLLEPLAAAPEGLTELQFRVLDRRPFQSSVLHLLYHQHLQGTAPEPGEQKIPAIAQSYLALEADLYPVIPQIHDVWEQEGRVVMLLEDRQDFPLLKDFWNAPDILPLQLLYWMHEMTRLWETLHPRKLAESLLEVSNLHLDEDQVICLQRLYPDVLETPPTLQDLGHLWLVLFDKSAQPANQTLQSLCDNMAIGEIATLETLKSQLDAIAIDLQNRDSTFQLNDEPFALSEISESSGLSGSDVMPSSEPIPNPSPEPSLPPLKESSEPLYVQVNEVDEDFSSEGDDIPTVVLPMKLISIEDAGRSDVGLQREHNEDFFSIQTEISKVESLGGRTLQFKGLYILCDGMGGHAGGEVASAMAVDTLKQYFQEHWGDRLPEEADIRNAILHANEVIFKQNQDSDRSGVGRMGTTLVMVLIQDTKAVVAHVGDSRLYRFSRRRGLEQVTTDHEVGQREIQRGVEEAIAYARPDAYQLTQALGPRDQNFINPDVQFIELSEDLLLLLCSDGLSDNDLLETHWRTHLEPLLSSQTNLEQGVSQLIDLANQYNGHDNITAVAVRAKVRPNLDQLRRP